MGGGRGRVFKPRVRNLHSLITNSLDSDNSKPTYPEPILQEEGWFFPNPHAARLHNKSGIGIQVSGGIILNCEELIFCHLHRHVPLPKDFIVNNLTKDQDIFARILVYEYTRKGGEISIPISNNRYSEYFEKSSLLLWSRDKSWQSERPDTHIRWFWSKQAVDWEDIFRWVDEVQALNCNADIYIIDEELEVTGYRLSFEDLQGVNQTWNDLSPSEKASLIELYNQRTESKIGSFIDDLEAWPLKSIGYEHFSGVNLNPDEMNWLESKIQSGNDRESLFDNLVDRGLILRSGFKYGCKWRVYNDTIQSCHAPWLVEPVETSATNWQGVCLSVRLAAGVHKLWVCAKHYSGNWKFLSISRWTSGKK